ncbi:hypothetical protein GH714_043238 [Hevea brasiliensis]|uniref:BHLH domain-containing protein n=1 Tax=Hevea brasiliensis TaxID=3981 RepID=A0A6A6K258_HEVBR|nr:hypothetical protein GH714_043238 [Hevea brasiliensis]
MELPQQHRLFETEGKNAAKEETTGEISSLEKPPPPAPPPSVEHTLPGGIGTYTISHISNYFNQRISKPEGSAIFTVAQASSAEKNEDDSNCSSYTGSGFTLWEESALKKGKTRRRMREKDPTLPSGQKGHSFIEMIKSAKDSAQDDNLDDEEEFVLKKESPSPIHKGELRVKVDGKSTDHKANTPRSKHSATEQRRRSKINDRFQRLRELIPHGDQKRDKASFLLEVIEYIQFLQEKVQKYEGSYQGWNHAPAKLVPLRNGNRPSESYVDQSRGMNSGAGPAFLFAAKVDEKNIALSPTIPRSTRNPVESDIKSDTAFKLLDHHPEITNKAMPFPTSLQPNFFSSCRTGGAVAQVPPRMVQMPRI